MRVILTSVLILSVWGPLWANPLDIDDYDSHHLGGIVDHIIRKIIEDIRKKLPEPISFSHEEIHFPSNALLNGSFKADNFTTSGIKAFEITTLHVAGLSKVNMSFLFRDVHLNTQYWCDLLAGEIFPAYGAGTADIRVSNFSFHLTGDLNLQPGRGFSNLKVAFDVDKIKFVVSGMLYNEPFSALTSAVWSHMFPEFIHRERELISEVVSPLIQATINALVFPPKPTTTPAPTTTPLPTTTTTTPLPTTKTTKSSPSTETTTTARVTKRTTAKSLEIASEEVKTTEENLNSKTIKDSAYLLFKRMFEQFGPKLL